MMKPLKITTKNPEQQAVQELRAAMNSLIISATFMILAGRAEPSREITEITRRLKGIEGQFKNNPPIPGSSYERQQPR